MTTELQSDLTVADVRFEDHRLVVDLADGRTIVTPIGWFARLREATDEQLANWHPSAADTGIHWPDVDEDLSVDGLLRSTGSPEGAK
jgi:hypothetical protein